MTTEDPRASKDLAQVSWNTRSLMSGSALRVTSLVLNAVVSLIIMPFVVHALGDRIYGIWAVLGSVIGYYGVLDLGMSAATNRHLAAAIGSGDEEQGNCVLNTALRIYIVLGAVTLVLSGVLAGLAPMFTTTTEDARVFAKVILILGLSVATAFPAKVFTGALDASFRFTRTASLEIVALGVRSALVVSLVALGFKVVGLALATCLVGVLTASLTVYFTLTELPAFRVATRYWSKATARTLFSFSLFSFIVHVADTVRFQLDNVIVAGFVGLAGVTHYAIAGRLAGYFLGLMLAIMGVFLSVFSRQDGAKDYAGIRRTLLLSSKISVCVSSFFAFGLIAWGKLFLQRWMGPEYLDAYPCLVALVVGLLCALWQSPSISFLYGTSRHRFLAVATSVESACNLVLSILLAPRYGMLGVAVGTMIPMVVSKLVVQPVYVCRAAGIVYLEYLWSGVKLLGAVALSLIVPVLLTLWWGTASYATLALLGCASAICYSMPLWFLVFTASEADLLRRAALPALLTPKRAWQG